jgi:uroporphyrinogen decarboxylase
MTDARRDRFLKSLRGDDVDRPPLWLMRQAGRYLPGYRSIRAERSFLELAHSAELTTKAALEPLELFPLDAAIVFSDILVIPDALGLGLSFEKGDGPKLARPMRTRADYDLWQHDGARERMQFVSNAVRHLRGHVGESHGIIGFAGAPFTLFAYSVEGGGSDDFARARCMLHDDASFATTVLSTIADLVGDLLLDQIAAGADAVQVFDTWGGLLSARDYAAFAAPAIARIAAKIKPTGVPLLLYIKAGAHLLHVVNDCNVDGLSVDWRVPLSTARRALPNHILQGNFDPVALLSSTMGVKREARAFLDEIREVGTNKLILNLGHGILPGTAPEAVAAFCDVLTGR